MKKLGSGHVQDILDSLLNLISPKSRAELREVAGIALKTVVMEVPEEEFQSGSFTKRLVPKLLQMITDVRVLLVSFIFTYSIADGIQRTNTEPRHAGSNAL